MDLTNAAATSSSPITGLDASDPEVIAAECYLRETMAEIVGLCRSDPAFCEVLIEVIENQQINPRLSVHGIMRWGFDKLLDVLNGHDSHEELDDQLCTHLATTGLIVFAVVGVEFSERAGRLVEKFLQGEIHCDHLLLQMTRPEYKLDDDQMTKVIARRFPYTVH